MTLRSRLQERVPRVFTGNRTGTRIEIRRLKDRWTRGMVRELCREVTSICSPFGGPENFRAEVSLEPDLGWLSGLLQVDDVLELALFRAKCEIEGTKLTYDYRFSPLPGMERVEGRRSKPKPMNLPQGSSLSERDGKNLKIGKVRLDLHIFDLDPQVLALGVSDRKGFASFWSTMEEFEPIGMVCEFMTMANRATTGLT